MDPLRRCQIHPSEPRPEALYAAPGPEPTYLCGGCLPTWRRSSGQHQVKVIGRSEPVEIEAIIALEEAGL